MVLNVYSKEKLTKIAHFRLTPSDKKMLKDLGGGRTSTGLQVLLELTRHLALKKIEDLKKKKIIKNVEKKLIKKKSRSRRFTKEEKIKIAKEANSTYRGFSEVARKYKINVATLFYWKKIYLSRGEDLKEVKKVYKMFKNVTENKK